MSCQKPSYQFAERASSGHLNAAETGYIESSMPLLNGQGPRVDGPTTDFSVSSYTEQ